MLAHLSIHTNSVGGKCHSSWKKVLNMQIYLYLLGVCVLGICILYICIVCLKFIGHTPSHYRMENILLLFKCIEGNFIEIKERLVAGFFFLLHFLIERKSPEK